MKEKLINIILAGMNDSLSKSQMSILLSVLTSSFEKVNITVNETALSTTFADNEFYLDAYLTVKKLAGLQESTLEAYEYEIKRFFDITGCDIPRVETNTIRKYLYDRQKVSSNKTVDNIRRYLNCFFQFLADENYIAKNPVKQIPKIKDESRIARFGNDYEMELLRDCCETDRELALIDLLISTGLRVHEVPQIKLDDIDWNQRIILIHGKGAKDRIVPFSVRAAKHLQDYLQNRKEKSPYLFCRTRKPYDVEPSKAMINDLFSKIRKRTGINDITIHCVRRWFATYMNDHGADSTVLQDIMGHASFNTTKKFYLDQNIQHITQVHKLCAM